MSSEDNVPGNNPVGTDTVGGAGRVAPVTGKPRIATVWLDGCSGCHMSLIDMDERLIEIGERADIVYSPLVDYKEYPTDVDVVLVEGAVSTDEDLHKIKMVRERSKVLISFGDCAVTSNVPGMRNPFGGDRAQPLYQTAYIDNATLNQQFPTEHVPQHLPRSMPVHKVVKVDIFMPGCPPSADMIYNTINDLLEGRTPDTASMGHFGG